MSNKYNTLWLESAIENYETAKEQGDQSMMKAVIADMIEAGFGPEARKLQEIKVSL